MINIQSWMERSRQLELKIQQCNEIIHSAPAGRLIARKRGNSEFAYSQCLNRAGNRPKEIYLGRQQQEIVYSLAEKMYAEKQVVDLVREKEAVDQMIAAYAAKSEAEEFLKTHIGVEEILRAKNSDDWAKEWKYAPYKKNMKYPEALRFSTVVPELMVRSKSEADIIARLEHFDVPYHYEEIFVANGVELAMDLTCRNRRTRCIFYWDHQGMLDNPGYIQKTLNCEALMLNSGLIPWKNLIITTETKDYPLDLQWVDTIIQYYLL